VAAWPGVEPSPLPVASADLVSLRVSEDAANDDLSVFITGREFGRVLFGSPTIYLTLPLSCAHWTIVRGWAEPHYSSSFGLVPPGVMVIYTPRDELEVAVCRWLFRVSCTFASRDKRRKSGIDGSLPFVHESLRKIQLGLNYDLSKHENNESSKVCRPEVLGLENTTSHAVTIGAEDGTATRFSSKK
jgi:hypothetical protein